MHIALSRYWNSGGNPLAPPDRRYRIARRCLAGDVRPSFARDDKPTWELWRFLRNVAAAADPPQRARLLMAHPGLAIAFQLHHGRMRRLRPVVEAYLLAGTDDAGLAQRLAVPTDAVDWYRMAFYDVARLRHAGPRVMQDLIGIVDDEGHAALDQHTLWKVVGYHGGPAALDSLLYGPAGPREPAQGADLATWFSNQTQQALQAQQLIAAGRLRGDDPKHAALLLKLWLQQQRTARLADETPLNVLERHIHAMLGEIPWCHGAVAETLYAGTAVGKFDEGAAELRDDELQLMAAAEKVPGLEEIAGLEMPPARDRQATAAAAAGASNVT